PVGRKNAAAADATRWPEEADRHLREPRRQGDDDPVSLTNRKVRWVTYSIDLEVRAPNWPLFDKSQRQIRSHGLWSSPPVARYRCSESNVRSSSIRENNAMKTVIAIVLSAGMALPFAAFAQSSDVDYCNKLSATYRSSSMANAAPQAKIPEAM